MCNLTCPIKLVKCFTSTARDQEQRTVAEWRFAVDLQLFAITQSQFKQALKLFQAIQDILFRRGVRQDIVRAALALPGSKLVGQKAGIDIQALKLAVLDLVSCAHKLNLNFAPGRIIGFEKFV